MTQLKGGIYYFIVITLYQQQPISSFKQQCPFKHIAPSRTSWFSTAFIQVVTKTVQCKMINIYNLSYHYNNSIKLLHTDLINKGAMAWGWQLFLGPIQYTIYTCRLSISYIQHGSPMWETKNKIIMSYHIVSYHIYFTGPVS